MRSPYLSVVFLLLLLAVGSSAQAQEPAKPAALIRLQATTFEPLPTTAPLIAANGQTSPYYLVQFSGPVEALWVQQIAALGGQILGYIPDNAHIVRLAAQAVPNVRSLPGVRWVGAYQPAYKLAPDLAISAAQVGVDGVALELLVLGFSDTTLDVLDAVLRSHGATVQDATQSPVGPLFRLMLPPQAVAALIQEPLISWIEPYLEPQLANAEGRKIMGAEAVWQTYGYFGAGQIIAISDSGLSVQNNLTPDVGNRLVRAFPPSEMNLATPDCMAKTTWTDLNGHGTHVTGSVLGNGTRSGSSAATHAYTGSHAGIAPEAQLVFMALNTDGSSGIQCIDLNGDFVAKGYQAGARISTNSWGANDRGGYNLLSSLVDDFIWRHKDYFVLYAAGNAGPGAQTIGSPGTAKNVLTVGASENNRPDQDAQSDNPDTMASFSSRGPTADGRIKPDVVAPGTWILSMRAAQAPDSSFWGNFNRDYAFMGGTSMATPLTAGAAALVREWLGKTRGLPTPSAALLKAIMMNGATQLPGETTPSTDSGSGRVDLKNTLNAQYALMDDHVQGLTTNQLITYSVQIVATTPLGNLLATSAQSSVSTEIQAAALTSIQLVDALPVLADDTGLSGPDAFTGEPLPSFATARQQTPVPTLSGRNKQGLVPLTNPVPSIGAGAASAAGMTSQGHFNSQVAEDQPGQFSFQQNMIGGGDFEDPDWSLDWSEVWLGSGIPVRTDDPMYVINGNYSMWLGGTLVNDALLYPVQFPAAIDNDFPSGIALNVGIIDEDLDENGVPFDEFCVALIDASGNFIGPYAPANPECVGENGGYTYSLAFTAEHKQALADTTGYLVVYTEGDAVEPHMSAFVDDIRLIIDFPDVAATVLPAAGPPGTKFLLTGQYNVPYGQVDICFDPCSEANYIDSAYADARGDIAIFLYSSTTIEPGVYNLQTYNAAARTANTTITIVGDATPSLDVTPATGVAGTKFQFSGSNFLPNDTQIQATLNGTPFGTVGSNANGEVAFALATTTNTPANDYELQLTDGGGRSAAITFAVTAVASGNPTLVVTPAAGPPGTTFTFEAANFTAGAATVELDGQMIGQITVDTSGSAKLTLETKGETAPGTYTLAVSQSEKRATAQYEVTSGGTVPQTGTGLYVTLVWTDPPAQAAAAQTLVNDLDLTLAGPTGQLFGNGGATADRKNNAEVIRLENPTAGTYVITVQAQRVNATFGSQPYALVATTKQNFESHSNNLNLDQVGDGVLTGVVFVDANNNGVRDEGEAGIGGMTVVIQQTNGTLSRQITTDASGAYQFANLPFDTYTITVILPTGFRVTTTTTLTTQVNNGSTAGPAIGIAAQLFLPLVQR